MTENNNPGNTAASSKPCQISNDNNNHQHQLPHRPKPELSTNNQKRPPTHRSTTPKPTTMITSSNSLTISSPRATSTPSTLDHPPQGGKWINPELVHDNIGHPTLGGTYPAGRPCPGGRRFSKRIAQKKWLARIISSPRDKDIGRFADTDTEAETETETEAGSGIENSTLPEESEEDIRRTTWGLLEGVPEEGWEER